MIFYEFNKPNSAPITQNKVIGGLDNITFYEVSDLINIKETYLPLSKDITKLDLECARYLRKGIFTRYDEKAKKEKLDMTEEEIAKGLEIRKLIKIIKLRKYNEDLIQNAFPILSNEKLSWERQKTEADLYMADNTTDVPFISTLAAARGITIDDLVVKILEKAEAYALFVASTLGTQHKQEKEIENCTILEELDALDLPDFCTFYFDK